MHSDNRHLQDSIPVLVKRLPHFEGLELPDYATDGAAGMDVLSAEDVTLVPGARHAVATGLAVAIPPGFEILQSEFHFYTKGAEVASTQADKTVALSRDEAHEYLVMDHVATHKGATLPAAMALAATTPGLRAQLADPVWPAQLYVQVDPDGRPLGAFRDETCRQPADAAVAAVVATARFVPALKAGQPVAGVAVVRPVELAP